jgi:hypothetical protein
MPHVSHRVSDGVENGNSSPTSNSHLADRSQSSFGIGIPDEGYAWHAYEGILYLAGLHVV